MPAASTTRPASTNRPTRSSVHVNCLRCAIFVPPFNSFYDVSFIYQFHRVTRETVSDNRLSFVTALPVRPRNKLRLRAKPRNGSPPFSRCRPRFRWKRRERRASWPRHSENSPEQNRPGGVAWREAPLLRRRRAAAKLG